MSLHKIISSLVPFVCVMLGCVLTITYVHALSLFLRNLVYK